MRISLCLLNLLPVALGLKTNPIKPGQLNQNTTKRAVPESRIVGGYEVDPPFMYPFLASLQRFRKPFCGGALYDENTVITAAHCTNGEAVIGFDAVLHRHDLSLDDVVEHGIRRRVVKRIRHAEYDEEVVKNDIAIWKLEPNNNYYGNFVSTLSLDDGSVPKNGYVLGRVAGWGYTSSGGVESSKLLEVKLPFYDMAKCGKAYEEVGGYLDPKKQICAGYPEGGKDACQGDSGGPLFAKKGKHFILVGVVSWGIGCATPGIPGIYTRIEAYQDWIAQNMK